MYAYAGDGLGCLSDGVQRELWSASYHCSQCCPRQLEGKGSL